MSTDEKIIGGGLAIGWAVLIGMIVWSDLEAVGWALAVIVPIGSFYWWLFRAARRKERQQR